MSAFKKVKAPERLLWKQRGGAVVFLESEDDYEIIAKRWFFDEGADVLFEPADRHEPDTGGGGCEAVIALVAGARADGVAAFGLVDRDLLLGMHNWVLWWQEADEAFLAARPHGDSIRVLLRWELENYLLDPDAMAEVANDHELKSSQTGDAMVNACLAFADELKDKSAATVAATTANQPSPKPGFGCTPLKRGSQLKADLVGHLTKLRIPNPGPALDQERVKIDRFDRTSVSPRERWERLTRMLDGKAALKYLSHTCPVRFDEHIGFLARRIREMGKVPAEIRDRIDEFKLVARST
ncbi:MULTISPECIES: hypothetical protein [Thiorhodovibrio]|uniref:hypothetical protein n=1 Tax=Thiorhodovibrio TaxID=61593 RepID=UPI001911D761|nr:MULTISPECIES: hypothetical protein [Thiorhodovibrio]MBK5970034.1 hypothetical protein [Thiorhodovibrio winogradskyi]WPL12961.1 hypothetical protein Thiosp_02746 [Thiorhodovibrio litoralis]